MYCTQCGQGNNDEAKFCNSCGVDLRHQTSPEQKTDNDQLDDSLTNLAVDIPEETFAIGVLYANRYEILAEGKAGGMGAVFKCKDIKLNETVALKIIHPRLINSKNALSRFRQEVAISRRLYHEGIVKVFNLEEWEGMEYFTMEWIEGVTLREVIEEYKEEKKPFSLAEANIIIGQLTEALTYAHQYTIHRDIKPENILIEGAGDQGLVVSEKTKIKLTDFGIAKMLNPSQFTSTSIQMGTPYYMAPEQKVDAGAVDKRADIYACGVLLFEMLTLENTIGFELPSQINEVLSEEVDEIVKKAVATKPEKRYGGAGELKDAVIAVYETERNRMAEEEMREEEVEVIKQREEEGRKREEKKALQKAEAKNIKNVIEKAEYERKEMTRAEKAMKAEPECKKKEVVVTAERVNVTDQYAGEMVYVKGGCYQMGDQYEVGGSDEQPVHEVCVDDYYIGKYEVTQGQWKEIMGSNSSFFSNCGDNCPVEQVSWDEVQEYIRKLNQKTGKSYRLPTEAEWEYACRSGGKKEKYCGGSDAGSVAWNRDNSLKTTHPVGEKRANGLGIYDMSGNVWEWVNDWHDKDYYKNSPRNNPKGSASGDCRVLRGGSWYSGPDSMRSSSRSRLAPSYRNTNVGFRVALSPYD